MSKSVLLHGKIARDRKFPTSNSLALPPSVNKYRRGLSALLTSFSFVLASHVWPPLFHIFFRFNLSLYPLSAVASSVYSQSTPNTALTPPSRLVFTSLPP